jgi:hypothetical protein
MLTEFTCVPHAGLSRRDNGEQDVLSEFPFEEGCLTPPGNYEYPGALDALYLFLWG